MKFITTSFGEGTFVRFKNRKSHPWEYGIYRGVQVVDGRTTGYEFSETPLGPITRWLGYWPAFIEAAVTPMAFERRQAGIPDSRGSGS